MANVYAGRAVKISGIARHTETEWSFTLDVGFPARPGQFVMVSVPHSGEVPFAVSGIGEQTAEITVHRVGKVTTGLFRRRVGDSVHVRGPYGQGFPLDAFEGRHLLVITGGSGLAAVKTLVEHYLNGSRRSTERLDVLAGFRSTGHLLFQRELKHWARDCGVLVTVDRHEDDSEAWAGGIGFVVDYVKRVEGVGPNTRAVVVGPPLMMKNTVRELLDHRVRPENIWLSFERHMKCGIGKCGHCRIGDKYVCLDGPVFNYVVAQSLID